MKQNILIILDNIEKTINQNVEYWLKELDQEGYKKNIMELKSQKDFSFIVFEDIYTLDSIKKSPQINKILELNKDVVFYIVLHKSVLGNIEDDIKKSFSNEFKTPYVIAESHYENEGFYHDVMPLIIKENTVCLAEVINGYFKTDQKIDQSNLLNQKLTFLHDLLGDKLSNEEIDKKLKEFNCSFNYNSDNKNASIIAIRNAILKS